MITDLLSRHIACKERVSDWKEAIALAAQPLVEDGSISTGYVQAMIHNVEENGPYIVIMPDVAMPHSRVEDGAFQTAVSILKLKEAVMFPQEKEVHLLLVLAAKDNDAHMQLLSDMVDVFMDEALMEQILQANEEARLRSLLS